MFRLAPTILAVCLACSESREHASSASQGELHRVAATSTAETERASDAEDGKPPAEQVVWEHATGQHVLDDRADLYGSPDVTVRLAFVRNANESIQGLFDRRADRAGDRTTEDQLRPLLARSGYDLMQTPFDQIHEKMWGRRLAQVFAAASPLLGKAEWTPDDFALAESFAQYAGLMPCGPRLHPTGTDWRHDQLEIAEYGRWLDAQLCEPSFRGGLILGFFVIGPLRPVLLEDFGVQPHSSSAIAGSLELRLADRAQSRPRSLIGDVAFAWFFGRNPGLPPDGTIVQAVGPDGQVRWTCSLPGMGYAWLSPAELDDPCGWRVRLRQDGQVSGGNELMLFLDQDCRPSFYMVKFD